MISARRPIVQPVFDPSSRTRCDFAGPIGEISRFVTANWLHASRPS